MIFLELVRLYEKIASAFEECTLVAGEFIKICIVILALFSIIYSGFHIFNFSLLHIFRKKYNKEESSNSEVILNYKERMRRKRQQELEERERKRKLLEKEKENKEFVRNNSEIYKQLIQLNNTVRFQRIPSCSYEKRCTSKQEYDRVSLSMVFEEYVLENLEELRGIASDIRSNREIKEAYEEQLALLYADMGSGTLYEEYPFFLQYEKELCNQIKFHFEQTYMDVQIKISKYYLSNKGRNEYYDNEIFFLDYLELKLEKIELNERRKNRESARRQYQRSLMTPSLRYDIMKRDNFCCVLCGASANDGVKLHVDHILPVSKGGLTEESNLRTLCEDCNLGKRDKYDAYGPN